MDSEKLSNKTDLSTEETISLLKEENKQLQEKNASLIKENKQLKADSICGGCGFKNDKCAVCHGFRCKMCSKADGRICGSCCEFFCETCASNINCQDENCQIQFCKSSVISECPSCGKSEIPE